MSRSAPALAWLLVSSRARMHAAEAARAAADSSVMARADAAGLRAERSGLLERIDELTEQHDRAVARLRRAESEAAAAQAALTSEREAGAQREQLLLRRDAELKQAFQALSADALARNNEQFVALAEGRIKEAAAALHAKASGDEVARAHAIAQLLDPMAATLQRVEGQLRTVEKEREAAYAGLREQVDAPCGPARSCCAGRPNSWSTRCARRRSGAAGASCSWSASCSWPAWSRTATSPPRSPARASRAGCGRTWWSGWPAASRSWSTPRCPSPPTWRRWSPPTRTCTPSGWPRTPASCASTSTRSAPRATGPRSSPSPEFVVLFVPGDPFLEAALRADPALLEHAFAQNVVVATPTTLIALLRTVAYSWRQEALAENAAQVHQLGKELHSRLATMGTHVAKLGRSLDAAVSSYNQTVSSLEARVLVSARKFTDLEVADGELPAPGLLERAPRTIAAPELVASAADALISLHELDRPGAPTRPESRATVTG